MKMKPIFYPVFLCLFSIVSVAAVGVSNVVAAEAKPAPVAQKAPVAKKQPAARAKVAPRQDSSHLTKVESSSPKKSTPTQTASAKPASARAGQKVPAKKASDAGDKVGTSLETFAKNCITSMNKQRRPGISHKEVKRQADGSYMARYMAVDPDSLAISYNPTENNKTIKYIGRMDYHEVEYVCTGKDQKQALAGPFSEANRTPITELIKYKSGKWTY